MIRKSRRRRCTRSHQDARALSPSACVVFGHPCGRRFAPSVDGRRATNQSTDAVGAEVASGNRKPQTAKANDECQPFPERPQFITQKQTRPWEFRSRMPLMMSETNVALGASNFLTSLPSGRFVTVN